MYCYLEVVRSPLQVVRTCKFPIGSIDLTKNRNEPHTTTASETRRTLTEIFIYHAWVLSMKDILNFAVKAQAQTAEAVASLAIIDD